MSAELCIEVDELDRVRRHFDCIRVYRSQHRDGTYVELTTPDSRLALSPGQETYSFSDPTGDGTFWYATAWYNSAQHQLSSRSEPVQASCRDGAEDLLDLDELRQGYLFGLRLTDSAGRPMPDSVFRVGLRAAVARVQRRLGLQLAPKEICDEAHDVRVSTAAVIPLANLRVVPVLKVRALRLRFGGPANPPTTLDPSTIHLQPFEGKIELRGYGGNAPGYPLAGLMARPMAAYLQVRNALYGPMRGPGALRVDYTAGFRRGELPADIKDLLAKAACLHPLAVAGDLTQPAGIGSSSINFDGFGQSIGRTANQQGNAYASRINDYNKQIEDEITRLRSFYRGLFLRVV